MIRNSGKTVLTVAAVLTGGCASFDNRVPAWGADLVGVTQYNRVVSFNHSTPGTLESSVGISGLAADEKAIAIDYRPGSGELYALGSGGHLYTLNWQTGVATPKATLHAASGDRYTALDGQLFDIDFDPAGAGLRVVSDAGQNLNVNPDNGEVTTQTAFIADKSVPIAVAYTTAANGAFRSTLYLIDAKSNGLDSVLAPAEGRTVAVGSFGGDFGRYAGFDIIGNEARGTAFAALSVPDTATSKLYFIQLGSGTAKSYGTIGGGAKIRSLSIRPSLQS